MLFDKKFKYYKIDEYNSRKIIEEIKGTLEKDDRVTLAIIFGSFIELNSFRDIDIAVYGPKIDLEDVIEISVKLEEKLKLPVDVVPMDKIASTFRYHILTRGQVMLEKISGTYEALLSLTFDELDSLKMLKGSWGEQTRMSNRDQ